MHSKRLVAVGSNMVQHDTSAHADQHTHSSALLHRHSELERLRNAGFMQLAPMCYRKAV
jgi:hypothetical protein